MPVKVPASGPLNARIMIVGEAPGADEEIAGRPFVGSSGMELNKMLAEAGIAREACFLTNACRYRPPENKIEYFFLDKKCSQPNELILEGLEELKQEIALVKPELIISMGGTSLWAIAKGAYNVRAAKGFVTKWRGSMLYHSYSPHGTEPGVQRKAIFLPTYHPAYINRNWEFRSISVRDLKQAKAALDARAWPEDLSRITVRPDFSTVMDVLGTLLRKANEASSPLPLASDLETRARYISCHAIAWSDTEAISIPTLSVGRPHGYWTLDEEVAIWERERELLTHPHVEIIGQNYLYDAQYFARRKGYVPRLRHDTMFQQSVAYTCLPKGLDFLSSMYCRHHVYWKDEGKEWTPGMPEEQHWGYNGKDAIKTWEIFHVLREVIKHLGLEQTYAFQMSLWPIILRMMLRGVRIDKEKRSGVAAELIHAGMERTRDINFIVGRELNTSSPKQLAHLFYQELGCKQIRNPKTKQLTCDEDALLLIGQREPLFRGLTERIIDARSISTLMSHVIKAELDADGRIRSSFSPTKETYRWGSSKNAFGGGANLQNWTKGDEDKEKDQVKGYPIPNVRKLTIPDSDCEIASIDLTGADAQTVAWEANDEDLKAVFRANKIKIHAHNAMKMWPGICKTGFEQPYYDLIRTGVHLVDYCGSDKTLAGALGCPVYEATRFRRAWFGLHPGILEWHGRVQDQLDRDRMVTNKFGYQRFCFERASDALPESVAWIGQSTTACVTNRALEAVENADNGQLILDLKIEFLIQVHDELVLQYPIRYREQVLKAIKPLIHITIPYDDPLVIPWGLKTSQVSWGHCEKRDWPQ